MLANLYMNRFLKHWRTRGCGAAFRAHLSYGTRASAYRDHHVSERPFLDSTQQAQLQTIGRSIVLLDLAFAGYGPDAAQGGNPHPLAQTSWWS